MSIRALDAAAAYANSLNRAGGAESAGPVDPVGKTGGFADLLTQSFTQAIDATAKQEATSAGQVAKTTELVDVVTAVNSAEIALETIVAVRDRMIGAYQEIMRMPI
jgi:flagellar hook-basal body complex protein FliE